MRNFEYVTLEKLKEIKNLSVKSESDTLDYKEIFSVKKCSSAGIELSKDIAAFANTKGGYIIFGVTNNYEWIGLDDRSDENIDDAYVHQLCEKYIDGKVEFVFNIHNIDNKEFIIFYIEQSKEIIPFKSLGQYKRSTRSGEQEMRVVFKDGDVFCRNGSRSMKANSIFYKQKKANFMTVNNLSQPPYHTFVGRDAQLEELHKLLIHDNTRLLQVDGIGGIGKTSLCFYYCQKLIGNELEHDFEFIIWMSAKRTIFAPDGEHCIRNYIASYDDVISEVLNFFDICFDETNENEKEQKVTEILNQYKILLVLDNMETLIEQKLIDFLFNIPQKSKALLTTRESISNFQMSRITLQGFIWKEEFVDFLYKEYTRLTKKEFTSYYKGYEEKIHLYTKGMPLAVQLSINQLVLNAPIHLVIDGLKSGKTYENLLDFCFRGSIQRLTAIEKNILSILAIPELDETYSITELEYISGYSDDELLIATQKLSAFSLCYITKVDEQIEYATSHLTKLYIRKFISIENNILQKYEQFKSERSEILSSDEEYLLRTRAKTHQHRLAALKIKNIMTTFFIKGYDSAIKILKDLEEEYNDFAYLYYMEGVLAKQSDIYNNTSIARMAFSNATSKDPDLIEAWIEWGFFEMERKQSNNAKNYFEAALKIEKDNIRANHGYAKVLVCISKGKKDIVHFKTADLHYEKAYYKINENHSDQQKHHNAINAHTQAINLLVYLNNPQKALIVCEKGLSYEPNNHRLLTLRGEIKKKINESIRCSKTAFIDNKSVNSPVYPKVGTLSKIADNIPIEILEKLLNLDKSKII